MMKFFKAPSLKKNVWTKFGFWFCCGDNGNLPDFSTISDNTGHSTCFKINNIMQPFTNEGSAL